MRKLAHIEKIESIHPIEGADNIEMAKVLGWECVVKKGEFKVGKPVIYVEVDSIMPDKPEYEFLRNRKFRIRTIKLRGQISQGLILPVSILEKNGIDFGQIGMDVTEILGITKYLSSSEKQELEEQERKIKNDKNKLRKFMMRYSWFRKLFLTKKQKLGFPYWVSKTDEERIQNIPHVLEQFKDKEIYITEKIDYQSGTWTGKIIPKFNGLLGKLIPIKKYKFIVCSRNMTTTDKNNLYWKIAKKYNLENILKQNPNLTIQGEQGDTKVQGNKYNIKEPTMWIFNIIDHEKNYHYNYDEMKEFCDKYKLNIVPIVGRGILKEFGETVDDLIKFSYAKQSMLASIHREGIVIRCIENGKKLLSFKVINPKFLLKYDE